MTQRNIDAMDIVVTKMAKGATLSKALQEVYIRRNVRIPYKAEYFNTPIVKFGLSRRATNALLRARAKTISDVIRFCKDNKITDISGLGVGCGVEIFEAILDDCWNHMSQDEKVTFLIDTIERNSDYIRAEIEL